MLRGGFFSGGLFVVLWGGSLFLVDSLVLSERAGSVKQKRALEAVSSVRDDGRREIGVPGWLPYTLLGIGGVTMLYSVALPRH